jgi:hypothetical protein
MHQTRCAKIEIFDLVLREINAIFSSPSASRSTINFFSYISAQSQEYPPQKDLDPTGQSLALFEYANERVHFSFRGDTADSAKVGAGINHTQKKGGKP